MTNAGDGEWGWLVNPAAALPGQAVPGAGVLSADGLRQAKAEISS